MSSKSNGRVYIARPIHKRGFTNAIIPSNPKIAVVYEDRVEISDLVSSLRIIIKDLQHCAKLEAENNDPNT